MIAERQLGVVNILNRALPAEVAGIESNPDYFRHGRDIVPYSDEDGEKLERILEERNIEYEAI